MPISYSYSINSMSCYPQYDSEKDVVFQVLWTLTGTTASQTSSYSGPTLLPAPQGDDFTPYSQLTEEQVIGWVENGTDPDYLANAHQWIADDIAAKENPPVTNPSLPWTPPPEPEAEAEVEAPVEAPAEPEVPAEPEAEAEVEAPAEPEPEVLAEPETPAEEPAE
jgi:outer membrane biosynthesis protein TonB